MRLLITGGTGFLGSVVVRRLAEKSSNKLALLVRNETQMRRGITTVVGSLEDEQSLMRAVRGADMVVHLAALINGTSAQLDETNVQGTRKLIAACKQEGVTKFIFVSSYLADATFEGPYAKSKRESEKLVMDFGLDWVVLRPAIIFGTGAGPLDPLIRFVKRHWVVPVLSGKLQPVSTEDVAEALRKIIEKPKFGKRYVIAGDTPISFESLARLIADELKLSRWFVKVPAALIRLAAAFKPSAITIANNLNAAMFLSTEQLRKDYAWKPKPFEPQFRASLRNQP